MSDSLPLPARPNLERYRKLAKDFQRAAGSTDREAIRNWAGRWATAFSWLNSNGGTPEVNNQSADAVKHIERRWQRFVTDNKLTPPYTLVKAQFFLAREHGFASWPKFAQHVEGLARASSQISKFEAAADAIVDGDMAALEKLVVENRELVRARSTREHKSTLLHYVSANGVEDFRQRTPPNIVEIAKFLLEAGADVNAESDAYGGGSTTLMLTATSYHPEKAGVQIALLQLLIARGAVIDSPGGSGAVNACLRNGRLAASEYLARHGARLDLEGAAGVGLLDQVRGFFDRKGALLPSATKPQMIDGFAWACQFGRTNVVEFLLERGMEVGAKLRHHGQTGLHWAAYNGHTSTVKLLLGRGSAVDVKDAEFSGTPLDWALYGWRNSVAAISGGYYEVVAMLVRHGARLDADWYEGDDDRRRAAEKIRADLRMAAALRGESQAG